MSDENSTSSVTDSERWTTIFCGKLPKAEIVYFTQITGIFIIIIACLVNLSLGTDKDSLWSSLLSANIGFLLPSPSLPKKKDVKQQQQLLPDATFQQ